MGAVFERLRSLYELHRRAAGRAIAAVLALAAGLVVVGGAIRLLEPPERATATPATSATPSPEWSATARKAARVWYSTSTPRARAHRPI
jgi:hypothetical protein